MRILLPLFLFFAIIQAHGQSFFPGSIETLGQQTLTGSISYNPNQATKGQLIFRPPDGGTDKIYRAEEIRGFTIGSRTQFRSYVEDKTGDHVFAELLFEGAVTVARIKTLYFLTKEDGSDLQIDMAVKTSTQDSRTDFTLKKKEQQFVIARIVTFLEDCNVERISDRLQMINEAKLKKVLELYNECKGSQLKDLSKGTSSFRVGAFAGVHVPNLSFKDAELDRYDSGPSVLAGVDVDLLPKSFHRKASFNVGLLWTKSQHLPASDAPDSLSATDLSFTNFRIPVSTKLFLRPGHSGFFIQPGATISRNTDAVFLSPYVGLFSISYHGFLGVGWEQNLGGNHWLVGSLRYERSLSEVYLTYNGTKSVYSDLVFTVGYRYHKGKR
jgi:hypothetical protein